MRHDGRRARRRRCPCWREVFREHGFEGASLAAHRRSAPASARAASITSSPAGRRRWRPPSWPRSTAGSPPASSSRCARSADAARAIAGMLKAVEEYFKSGQRVCLVGALALNDSRDLFAPAHPWLFRSLGRGAGGRPDPRRPRPQESPGPGRGDLGHDPGRAGPGPRPARSGGLSAHPGAAQEAAGAATEPSVRVRQLLDPACERIDEALQDLLGRGVGHSVVVGVEHALLVLEIDFGAVRAGRCPELTR